jgi:hypothetical protein
MVNHDTLIKLNNTKGGAVVGKRTGLLAAVLVFAFLVAGCASYLPMGYIYMDVKGPAAVGSEGFSYSKVGVAKATSVLGLVATGDCSVKAAMENGKINKVKYVDYQAKSIVGLVGEYTTTVYGD